MLFFYRAHIRDDSTPVLNVHSELKWVYPQELCALKFCPADRGVVEQLVNEYADNERTIKLGIVGTGMIAKEFLSISDRIKNITPVMILGRKQSRDRVEALGRQYGIRSIVYEYSDMLRDKNVDTVYIALPNDLHYEYAKRALEAGKNVILEKPFTLTLTEAQDLFRTAGRRKHFIFEALTRLHTPGFKEMKKNISRVGRVRLVEANFSKMSSRYDRFRKRDIAPVFDGTRGGGALMDMNVYNLQMAVALFGEPQKVEYYANMEYGVDISGILILKYKEFFCSLTAAKDSWNDAYFSVQGDKGLIMQRNPSDQGGSFSLETLKGGAEFFDGPNYHRHALEYEFTEFAGYILNKDTEAYEVMKKQTLAVAKVLEELRTSKDD